MKSEEQVKQKIEELKIEIENIAYPFKNEDEAIEWDVQNEKISILEWVLKE